MESSKESKFRSILVPLDSSESAEHALPMALSLARLHGAALHVVRIYVPVAGVEGEYAVRYDEALDRELMKRARDYLDSVVARLADAGVQFSSALLEGSVAGAISAHAVAVGADLIVMTTKGRGPVARFWLGSVSDELVRQSGVPILFVRPKTESADLTHEPVFHRVLIPLDGSILAEQVLDPMLALGAGFQAELTLLRVVTQMAELSYGPVGGKITGFQESLKQLQERDAQESNQAREYLARVAERLRARSVAANIRVAWSEWPAAAILDDAAAHRADLIALATHGRGGLKRLMLGSVADKVLRGADTTVLIYRPLDELARASDGEV